MAVIRVFKYNNYYNRRLKVDNTLAAYGDPIHVQTDVNFNPADGVNAKLVLGKPGNNYKGGGDYVLVEENSEFTRWFIVDQERTRYGQYNVTLYRDVIADNYEAALGADMFIEKATLPQTNPLIYNKENTSVNQIKKKETLIKDDSACAWIVGYLDRKYEGGQIELSSVDVVADFTAKYGIDKWEYKAYDGVENAVWNAPVAQHIMTEVNLSASPGGIGDDKFSLYEDFEYKTSTKTNTLKPQVQYVITNQFRRALTEKKDEMLVTAKRYRNLYTTTTTNSTKYKELLPLNGKIVRDAVSGTYYKIYSHRAYMEVDDPITSDKQDTYLYSYFNDTLGITTSQKPTYAVRSAYWGAYITLEAIEGAFTSHTVNMPGPTGRFHCKDAPFDMFCIPYTTDTIKNSAVTTFQNIKGNQTLFMNLAQSLASQLGSSLYDLQLVPFSPISGIERSAVDKTIDISYNDLARYTEVKDTRENNAMVLIWSTSTANTFTKPIEDLVDPSILTEDKKMMNECEMWRLVSPNYSSTFEFNFSKFDSIPTAFNVDFTYLPYSPFIRIAPQFSGLYGSDFHDARGLILSGDFSLMYTSDAWRNYQIQNKNYLQIFDREIQSLNFNNSIQNQNNLVSALAGTIAGGSTGALVGSAGGFIGAAAGTAIGAMTSAIGGIADIKNAKKLQEEAINYKADLFGYQLGNIKALPNSIAKSTAYNVINKIFPILEWYTCTDEEKEAIANKIAFNGMTVMAIGKMQDFVGNSWSYKGIQSKGYIKGQLIHIDVDDDYHIVAAIAEELDKGVYTTWAYKEA